jgi:phosphohistidine phosphatase SixA
MYLLNNLIALDQLVNTLLGGHADETLSSRAYRAEQTGKIFGKFFRPLIDAVFFWQKQHCYKGYLAEKQRRQLPSNF